MKKILMILFFVSVSMFSFGQSAEYVRTSFAMTLYDVCNVKANYDFITDHYTMTKKEIHDPFAISIVYNSYTKDFSYYIGDHEFSIGHARVIKLTRKNGIIDYIVEYEVEKESNGHKFYIPWIFKFTLGPDNEAVVTEVTYVNLKEYAKNK